MASKTRVTFHIGLEKTGTDSFQRFCTEQHALLRQHGVLYPTESVAFGEYNHEPLVACYLSYRDLSIRSSGRDRPEVLRSLAAEIRSAEADHVLISGEHFSSRFREHEIEQLAADFSAFDCRVVVVVREHRARLYSAYSQAVLAGRDMTLDAYCDEVLHPDNRYMRYAETISAWERIFDRQYLSVFRHARGQDIIPVLCGALFPADLPVPQSRSYWDNLSIGPGATEWLRRVNRAVAHIPGVASPTMRGMLYQPRRRLARFFAKINPNRDPSLWPLADANYRRLSEIVAIDNAWLEEHHGISLGEAAPQVAKVKATE
jgi:hypothetical protein